MEIKPRNHTGVLLYVGSTKDKENDFLLLELVDGRLRLTIDNGNGPLVAEVGGFQLLNVCDGQWHTVELLKMGNLVMLQFDQVTSGPRLQTSSKKLSADTDSPLYIGGHPLGVSPIQLASLGERFSTAWKAPTPFPGNYAGCLRKLSFNSKVTKSFNEYDFRSPLANYFVGEVSSSVCPAA